MTTNIVKCYKCKQKLGRNFAVVEDIQTDVVIDPTIPYDNGDVRFIHPGCQMDNAEHVTCGICGNEFKMITPGHLTKHDTTVREYKLRYGPVVSEGQAARLNQQSRIRGNDEQLRIEMTEVKRHLEGALLTIKGKDIAIVSLTDVVNELKESVESLTSINGEEIDLPDGIGIERVNTGPRTVGVVFTTEEIETIGAVALREMVKCKFGRHESRKEQNVEKLRSLVE